MVWGSIRVGYKPILIVLNDENHTSKRYIKYLKRAWAKMEQREPGYMARTDWIFQQDGASSEFIFSQNHLNRLISLEVSKKDQKHPKVLNSIFLNFF